MNRWIPIGMVALLLASATAPLAAAKEHPESATDAVEHRDAKRGAATIRINATGVTRANETYQISALGLARCKAVRDNEGNRTGLECAAKLRFTVRDANGTVVKEGKMKVRLGARENATGEWKWRLASRGLTWFGRPKLVLHGDAGEKVGDTLSLELGQGHAIFKPRGADHKVRLQIEEATVTVERV